MACRTLDIPEYVEGKLSPVERSRIAAHLTRCDACRAFADQLKQLDLELARTVKIPALPADFAEKLHGRIARDTAAPSPAQCLKDQQRLQGEFEAALARLRRSPVDQGLCLSILGAALLLGLAGGLIWLGTPALLASLAGKGLNGDSQRVAFCWIASTVFLLVGLAAAFPRPFQRMWE